MGLCFGVGQSPFLCILGRLGGAQEITSCEEGRLERERKTRDEGGERGEMDSGSFYDLNTGWKIR